MANAKVVEAKPLSEINLVDFASFVASMSRLLIGLASIPPFKDANLGLAEWVALSVLAEADGVSNKHLARSLGVTGQRANQICGSLSKANLISTTQSTEDNRKNEIRITETGRAQYNKVNSELKPLLAMALANKERSLSAANRMIKMMMRVVQSSNPGRAKKKAAKTAVAATPGA